MSPHKSPNIIKYCVITSTAAIVLIAVTLIPVSRKASYQNCCLNKIICWINVKEKDLKGWDKEAKKSLSVAVRNGAIYEPKLQKNNLLQQRNKLQVVKDL